MKYLTPAILAATFALSAGSAFATDPPSADTQATSSVKQSWKDCMAAQEAKNSGASQADMKKACKDAEKSGMSNSSSSVDSHPYGATPPPSSTAPTESPPPR